MIRNKTRWKRAQKAEAEFWFSEIKSPRYTDPTGEERRAGVAGELRHFGFDVQVAIRSAERILEVGSGPVGLIHFVETPALRIGIDSLMRALESSGYTNRYGVSRIEAMGEAIPLASESINILICFNVLDHCADPWQVLSDVHRILRPGGTLLLQLYTIAPYARPLAPLLSLVDPPHPFRFTHWQLVQFVTEAGLLMKHHHEFVPAHWELDLTRPLAKDTIRHFISNLIRRLSYITAVKRS